MAKQSIPTISVVTVNFNNAEGLARTLSSIAAQSYRNIESIIVDGGSNDGSFELIEALKIANSKVISEPDQGIYDAMNKGLKLVTGDVVQFLNAGDIYASDDCLTRVAEAFKTPNLKLVYGDCTFFNEDMKTVRHWRSGEFAAWKKYCGWAPNHSASFARKDLYSDYGDFDDSFLNAGDYDLFLRWMILGKIKPHYIPETLTRMEAGGVSNASVGNIFLGMKEVRRAWGRNKFRGGLIAPLGKVLQKVGQIIFK